MANHSRNNFISEMRLGVSDLKGIESYASFDMRAIISYLTATPVVLKGFEVQSVLLGVARITVAGAQVLWPDHPLGAFLSVSDAETDLQVSCLPAATTYLELDFRRKTINPIQRGIIDKTSISADNPRGTEVSLPIDSQDILYPVVTASNVRNSAKILIAEVVLNDSFTLLNLTDKRPMFGRLDTMEWSGMRQDDSSFATRDAAGVLNDRGLATVRDVLRALGSRIAEVSGIQDWYSDKQFPVFGLNTAKLFSLSESGMRFCPPSNIRIMWSQSQDKRLDVSANLPMTWQLNYSMVNFELFGAFSSETEHFAANPLDYSWNIPIADQTVLYLPVEMDVTRAGDLPVTWQATGGPAAWLDTTRVLYCATPAFDGAFIGDYIRRSDQGQSEYYQIVASSDGVSIEDRLGVAIGLHRFVLLDRPTLIAGVSRYRLTRQRYSVYELISVPRSESASQAFVDNMYFCARNGNNLHMRFIGTMIEGAIYAGGEPARIPRRVITTSTALDRFTRWAAVSTQSPVTLTLPPQLGDASSVLSGFDLVVKDELGFAGELITIQAPNGGKIDGQDEYKLSIFEGLRLCADGNGNWMSF